MPYPYYYTWRKKPERAGLIGPIPGKTPKGHTYNAIQDTTDELRVIEASLRRIMGTVPGDRVMLPEFGCNLRKFLFEPNDNILAIDIKKTIKNAIERWEPRVSVVNVLCQRIPDDHLLIVQLQYRILHLGIDAKISLSIY